MTTDADAFGIDLDDPNSGPADLREALKKANERAKTAESALQKERDDVAQKAKADKVVTFVKDKKLPDAAIKLIGDSDPDEWYTTFGALIKTEDTPPVPDATPPASEPSGPVGESSLSAEQRQAIAAVTSTEALSFDPNDSKAREAYLDGATGLDDYTDRLAKLGLLTGAQRPGA